jgi:hypothetical protein
MVKILYENYLEDSGLAKPFYGSLAVFQRLYPTAITGC